MLLLKLICICWEGKKGKHLMLANTKNKSIYTHKYDQ